MSLLFRAPISEPSFENMSPEVLEFLAVGYSHLATLPPASLDAIASQVSKWLDPACAEPEVATLARDVGIDAEAVDSLRVATLLQTTATSAGVRPMSPDAFVTKAMEAGALKGEHAAAVKRFGDEYLKKHSAEISDALSRAQSSTHIVPSFRSIDVTIDLRVAAVSDHRVVTMPVAIVSLQTDVPDRDLIFQMTARDAGQLVQQLKTVGEQLAQFRDTTTQPSRTHQ